RAPQAVGDGRVDELAVAEPVAAPGVPEEERRRVPPPHAPGHDALGVAGPDLGGREHDRLEPRPADAVDRRRAGPVRETGPERRLTGRGLADARLGERAP